jgi:site-specific recombinase XerD
VGKNAPTLAEVAAFLEAAEASGARDHALASLMTLNGLAASSVCEATVSDLGRRGDAPTLTVRLTVGGRPTPIPLEPRTAHSIDAYMDDRDDIEHHPDAPLLLADDGGPLQPWEAAAIIRRIARAAGLSYRLSDE